VNLGDKEAGAKALSSSSTVFNSVENLVCLEAVTKG
jgi:hypothetical protein